MLMVGFQWHQAYRIPVVLFAERVVSWKSSDACNYRATGLMSFGIDIEEKEEEEKMSQNNIG